MFNKIYMLMFLQLWLLIAPANAEGIKIAMYPEAHVEEAFITLGQVADISGNDTTKVNSLRKLKLGSAAVPGSSIVLTKELIGMRLAATGFDFSNIEWIIPDGITVTTRSQIISGQALIDKAVAGIEGQAGLRASGDLSIVPIGHVQDIIAPIGQSTLTSYLPYGIRYNVPTTVQMTTHVNGHLVAKVSLNFEVKLYRQVAVAASPISSGEMLTTEKLRYQRMDTGRLGPGYFTNMDKVLGLAAKRSLTPGMVVTDAMVNKPVLIKRGNLVNLIARIGSMEVTTAGQAMQDGSEGQLIRVQNINSAKIISAKVLDASTVQVLTYKSNGV